MSNEHELLLRVESFISIIGPLPLIQETNPRLALNSRVLTLMDIGLLDIFRQTNRRLRMLTRTEEDDISTVSSDESYSSDDSAVVEIATSMHQSLT